MASCSGDATLDPRSPATARLFGKSVLVIDAKALFDAIKKPGFTSQQDKRAAIEILCIQQKIKDLDCELRWVSSERMLADGMTKISARQSMVDRMKSGYIKLTFDENFKAAKKKTVEQRERDAHVVVLANLYAVRGLPDTSHASWRSWQVKLMDRMRRA